MIEHLNDNPPTTKPTPFYHIKLYPEISKVNYLCSLCHYFVMTFIFVSVESL